MSLTYFIAKRVFFTVTNDTFLYYNNLQGVEDFAQSCKEATEKSR